MMPKELQDLEEGGDDVPPPSARTIITYFTKEREAAAQQMPKVVVSEIEKLKALCQELCAQYENVALQCTGLVRAKVLRSWMQKQRQHLCEPPSTNYKNYYGAAPSWESSRAAVMLGLAHLVS